MKHKWMAVCLMLIAVLLFSGAAQATQIFVWVHDNNQRVPDPVLRASLTATESVVRTLERLDLDYDSSRTIPDDVGNYDVFITCLSFMCPG